MSRIALFFIMFIVLIIVSPIVLCGIVRTRKKIARRAKYKDGIDECSYIRIGGQKQYIWIMGCDVANPLIISLHGGPGGPTDYIDYEYMEYLTKDYTFVNWHQRGCGKTYFENITMDPDNKSLSFEKQLQDLNQLVDYLCKRFNKKKVIILGHSYGSVLGSRYVLEHPEKVLSYIGVGQVVNEKDCYSELYAYKDALKIAEESGKATAKLKAAYETFMNDKSINNLLKLRSVVEPFHPTEEKNDISVKASFTCPAFTKVDFKWFVIQLKFMLGDSRFVDLEKPLTEYLYQFDAHDYEMDYKVPVYFISGSEDWTAPVDLTRQYLDEISAPEKGLHLIQGCGHYPQGQLPEEFAQLVKTVIERTKQV